MPEYLAPGVYVEEVELAPRAIQMASTSTTGFVGLSLRGPINKPTLVTNYGEFERFFGGLEMVQPGIVPLPEWRGPGRSTRSPATREWGANPRG